MHITKRLLCAFLAFAMIFTMLPLQALAEETESIEDKQDTANIGNIVKPRAGDQTEEIAAFLNRSVTIEPIVFWANWETVEGEELISEFTTDEYGNAIFTPIGVGTIVLTSSFEFSGETVTKTVIVTVTEEESKEGPSFTITPNFSDAVVAYAVKDENGTWSGLHTGLVSGTPIVLENYVTEENNSVYVVFFVKPQNNHLILGMGASGLNDLFNVGGSYNNSTGLAGLSGSDVEAAAIAAGYQACFGFNRTWKPGNDMSGDNFAPASFTISGVEPTMELEISGIDDTAEYKPGDVLDLTVKVSPQRSEGQQSLTVNAITLNSLTINGKAVEGTQSLDSNGDLIVKVSYTVTPEDCVQRQFPVTADASVSYSYQLNADEASVVSASSITMEKTKVCQIKSKNGLYYTYQYDSTVGSVPSAIPEALRKPPESHIDVYKGESIQLRAPGEYLTYEDEANDGEWVFDGWYVTEKSDEEGHIGSLGKKKPGDSVTMGEYPMTAAGTWTFHPTPRTITYKYLNHPEEIDQTEWDETSYKGDHITQPEAATWEDYQFLGWYYDANDNGKIDSNEQAYQPGDDSFEMPAKDVTFLGKYVDKRTTYRVEHHFEDPNRPGHYNLDNEKDVQTVNGHVNSTVDVGQHVKTVDGYKLNKDKSDSGTVTILPYKETVIKLYYDCSRHNITYQLDADYAFDHPDLPKDEENIPYGATRQVSDQDMDKDVVGYTFQGWEPTGKLDIDKETGAFTMPNRNVEFVGSYKINSHDVIFHVEGAPEGTDFPTKTYEYGETVELEIPQIPGYIFSGWYADEEYQKTKENSFEMPDNDVPVYGYFTKRTDLSYTINYWWNGTQEEAKPSEIFEGQKFGALITRTDEELAIDGYTLIPKEGGYQLTIGEDNEDNVIDVYYYKNVTLDAKDETRTYNGQEQEAKPGYEVKLGETILKSVNFKDLAAPSGKGKDADTYEILFQEDVIGQVDSSQKYIVTEVLPGELTINPLTLKGDALYATMVYGEDVPELLYTELLLKQQMPREDQDRFDELIEVTLTHNGGSKPPVGKYDITFDGQERQGNYIVSIRPAVLTVVLPRNFPFVTKTHDAGEYDLGDRIHFTITVTNIYDKPATVNIVEQKGVKFEDVSGYELGAGETKTFDAYYTVQEEDILAGQVHNTVDWTLTVSGEKGPIIHGGQAEDTVPLTPRPALSVEKVADRATAAPGDTIRYTITVTNQGNLTLSNIQVEDSMGELLNAEDFDGTLAPGKSYEFHYEYTVTEADLGERIENIAKATASNPMGGDALEAQDSATVQVDTAQPRLAVEKRILNPQDSWRHGETIRYEILVTNTGNTTLRDLVLTDTMVNASGEVDFTDTGIGALTQGVPTLDELAPKGTWTVLCQYVVAEADGLAEAEGDRTMVNRASVTAGDGTTANDETPGSLAERLYTLTVRYLNTDGESIADDHVERLYAGEGYSVTTPAVPGYIIPEGSEVRNGTMPADDRTLVVVYADIPEPEPEPDPDPAEPGPGPAPEPEEEPDPAEELEEIPDEEPPLAPGTYLENPEDHSLTPIDEEETPLANTDLGGHTCCIMHFLLMLAAMIVYGFYTKSRKKHQARIFELKRKLAMKEQGKDPEQP